MVIKFGNMQTLDEMMHSSPEYILIDSSAFGTYFPLGKKTCQKNLFNLKNLVNEYPLYTTLPVIKTLMDSQKTLESYLQQNEICEPEECDGQRENIELLSKHNHVLNFNGHKQYNSLFDEIDEISKENAKILAEYPKYSHLSEAKLRLNKVDKDFLTSAFIISGIFDKRCVIISNNLKSLRVVREMKSRKNIRAYLTFYTRVEGDYFNKLFDEGKLPMAQDRFFVHSGKDF